MATLWLVNLVCPHGAAPADYSAGSPGIAGEEVKMVEVVAEAVEGILLSLTVIIVFIVLWKMR